jgi:asparagine synthase (glutamine-hydrolysing)
VKFKSLGLVIKDEVKMPGLIIVIQKNNKISFDQQCLKKAAAAICHESFYKIHYKEFDEIGLSSANVALDHEGSPSEGFRDEANGFFCMFSGELFSNELNTSLRSIGCNIQNTGNYSEVILKAYQNFGDSFFEKLNGYFHFIIVDQKKRKIIVSNDRFGIQRLFAFENDEYLIFAPEIKCFKKMEKLKLTLDYDVVAQFFKYNVPINNGTFFKEVSRLPIASKIIFENGCKRMEEYWAPEKVQLNSTLTPDEYTIRLVECFERISSDYFTPGQTGLSLTGGWDTRAILSCYSKNGIKLPCYTFAGMYRDSYDVIIAKKIAEKTGNIFSKIVLGEDFLKNFKFWFEKAIYVSDGLSRVTRCHEYYMNIQSRQYGRVRLTGKYGSQLVRSVTMLKDRTPDLSIFSQDFLSFINAEGNRFQPNGKISLLRYEIPQLESCAHSQEAAALTVRTPYLDNEFVNLMLAAPEFDDTSHLQKKIILRNNLELAQILTNRGEFAMKKRMGVVHKHIKKTMNLMDMAFNWEQLPKKYLWGCNLMELARFDNIFKGCKEWSFYRCWFKKDLQQYMRSIINDPITLERPIWNKKVIETLVDQHTSGFVNRTWEIDRVLAFEIWMRQML